MPTNPPTTTFPANAAPPPGLTFVVTGTSAGWYPGFENSDGEFVLASNLERARCDADKSHRRACLGPRRVRDDLNLFAGSTRDCGAACGKRCDRRRGDRLDQLGHIPLPRLSQETMR